MCCLTSNEPIKEDELNNKTLELNQKSTFEFNNNDSAGTETVKLCEKILHAAAECGASDIQISQQNGNIGFKVDGKTTYHDFLSSKSLQERRKELRLIAELLQFNSEISEAIMNSVSDWELEQLAYDKGLFIPMMHDAIKTIAYGIVDIEAVQHAVPTTKILPETSNVQNKQKSM